MIIKRHLLIATLVILLGFLQYQLWFDKGSILETVQYRKKIKIQLDINEALQTTNVELYNEVNNLKQEVNQIEEKARHDLGMIKEGETYYRVVE